MINIVTCSLVIQNQVFIFCKMIIELEYDFVSFHEDDQIEFCVTAQLISWIMCKLNALLSFLPVVAAANHQGIVIVIFACLY